MDPTALKSLNGQERHDYILKTFVLSKHKRDIDIIKEHHRFLWEDECVDHSWETKLARSYYDKLFKEYCIADLTRYKDNKVALRWRTEAEVVSGKGQFQCGSRKCEQREELRSWEVNFAYLEQGERKNALVKLRLCPEHSAQLNYTSHKREIKRLKKVERHRSKLAKRQRRRKDNSDDEAGSSISQLPSNNNSDTESKDANESLARGSPLANDLNSVTVEDAAEDIWRKKPEVEAEHNSRETDFERYLEDLLL